MNPPYPQKSMCVAYLFWFFLGVFGAHRFYLRKWCTAVLWLLTGGLFLIGWLIDLCVIPCLVNSTNLQMAGEASRYANLGTPSSASPPMVVNMNVNARDSYGTGASQGAMQSAPQSQFA